MDSTKCRIENGILYPCETLDKALQDGNCAKGLNYLEITHLPTGTVTKSMAVVHSGDLPKRGVVANYCPFCGEAIAHHVGGPKPCIPTETLEAGEVVPLALVDSIIREVLTNEEKYVPAAMLGNQGLNAYHGIMREIRNALSRLQQNGGEAK